MGSVPPHFQISNWGASLKLMTRDLDGRYSSIPRTSVSFSCVFFPFIRPAHSGGGGGTEISATKINSFFVFHFRIFVVPVPYGCDLRGICVQYQ